MDDFDRFEYFFATHWKKIVWTACVVVVAVGVGFWAHSHMNRQSRVAAEAIGAAMTIPALTEALAKYPSSPAAAMGHLRLASLQVAKNDLNAAAAELNKVIAAGKAAPELLWRAELNHAYVTELKGDLKAAANEFAALSKTKMSEACVSEAFANAGRLYIAAGDNDSALAVLNDAAAATGKFMLGDSNPANSVAGYRQQVVFLLAQLKSGAFGPVK